MAINEKYSYGDFTNVDLSSEPASDFNNSEIVASCFYQELPHDYTGSPFGLKVFPNGISGLTFTRCNIDNCQVNGHTLGDRTTNKKIQRQNDLDDWVVDSSGDPIEPMQKARCIALGLSIDPADIPAEKRQGNKSRLQEAEEAI